jgi:hypothetical protein
LKDSVHTLKVTLRIVEPPVRRRIVDLLAILSDPTHPEYGDMSAWAPPGFDPARFEVVEATMMMRSPMPRCEW